MIAHRVDHEEAIKVMRVLEGDGENGTVQRGAWYTCPAGHLYSIGHCGGAMEVSECPECGSRIGGAQHAVVSSNLFAGDLIGADEPTWPGQRVERFDVQ
eukprot:Trichotokara_eunicae@DN4536_c0_g1_i2.p1